MSHSQAVKEQLESHFRLHQEQLAIKDSEIAIKDSLIKTLKKENEELKNVYRQNIIHIFKVLNENNYTSYFIFSEQAGKYKQCLDEIEEIINFIFSIKNCDNAYYCKDKLKDILQLIKQAKEGK